MVDSAAQGSRAAAVSPAHTAEGGSLGRASSRSLHWRVSTAPPPVSLETVASADRTLPPPSPHRDAQHF